MTGKVILSNPVYGGINRLKPIANNPTMCNALFGITRSRLLIKLTVNKWKLSFRTLYPQTRNVKIDEQTEQHRHRDICWRE